MLDLDLLIEHALVHNHPVVSRRQNGSYRILFGEDILEAIIETRQEGQCVYLDGLTQDREDEILALLQ